MLLTKYNGIFQEVKSFLCLIGCGIGLIIIVYVVSKYFGSKQYKPDTSKYILETSVRYVDKPIYITKVKAKVDTIYEVSFINGDTVYLPQVYAKADTLIKKDSSSVKVTYWFPPKNYFDLDINIKEKIITNEIFKIMPYEPSFWDRFNIVIYGGVGYDFFTQKPTMSVGVGLGIDIKRIF